MAAKSRIVKWQKTREIITKKKYNGESSPYNEWVDKHSKKDEGESLEFPEANPDVLAEPDEIKENLTLKILKRDWREIKFSKREQEVLVLLVEGLTQDATAKRLGIKRTSVQKMIERIQKKSYNWYVVKMANSSLYSTEEESE